MSARQTLELAGFRLQLLAFETRYERGWRLWDRAGMIWTEMSVKYPSLKLVNAQPAVTVFRIDSKYELSVEIEKATTKAHNPGRTLEEFAHLASELLEVSRQQLEISDFTRLGLRTVYVKDYASADEASSAMLGLNLMRVPEGPLFNVKDAQPSLPEYAIRWETENLGATLRIKAEPRTYRIDFPFGWEGPGADVGSSGNDPVGLFLDVDCYTRSLVNANQLKTDEWITTGCRSIRKGLEQVLQGH